MNILDFYCNFYSRLGNYGMPYWVMTPIRRLVRYCANKTIPSYLNRPYNIGRDSDIIVSFTSFPARINEVWQVVECMKRQSLSPCKILLWLSKEQFPTEEDLPTNLKDRLDNVFEIRMVEGDIKSHKKYAYVCQEYPNSKVVLIDDDIYYPSDFIEQLHAAYVKTGRVVCKFGSIIQYDEEGYPLPYIQWKNSNNHTESDDFFFGSGGGVLFIPSLLYADVTNIELAMTLTPKADDIWLNAMVRLAKLKTLKLDSGILLSVGHSQEETLASSNLNDGGNDKQLKAINQFYKEKLGISVFGKF